eukprot:5804007-Pleurochrysis_carterae.AAC.1
METDAFFDSAGNPTTAITPASLVSLVKETLTSALNVPADFGEDAYSLSAAELGVMVDSSASTSPWYQGFPFMRWVDQFLMKPDAWMDPLRSGSTHLPPRRALRCALVILPVVWLCVLPDFLPVHGRRVLGC